MTGTVVDLWQVDLEQPQAVIDHAAHDLDEVEVTRAGRFVFAQDGDRYVLAHAAMHRILSGYLPAGTRARWMTGPSGKPRLADGPQFNLTHSGTVALVAVSRRRPVGVDVEQLRPGSDHVRVALWTRQEALAKAFGGRVLDLLRLPIAEDATQGVVVDGSVRVPAAHRVRDLASPPAGCRAAVAIAGRAPFYVHRLLWSWSASGEGSNQ